jgi:hypothetical protein
MDHRCARSVLLVCLVASGARLAHAQPASPPKAPEYLFLNRASTEAMAKALEAAGRQGFVIHSASKLSVLLTRGEPTPRVYKLVATRRESTLAKELNALGAQGFRIVSSSVMEFAGQWVVALEQQPQGARFMYDVVKGEGSFSRELNALLRQGGVIVGVVAIDPGEPRLTGNPPPVLIVERAEGNAAAAAVADHRYRIASTMTTSGLLKDVSALAAEGYQPIGSGFLTVVMERAPEATRGAFECQMVAALRSKTVVRELNDLGSKGYRVIPKAMPFAGNEDMFFLGRAPGATDSFHYILFLADTMTIDADLRRYAAEGYAPVGLIRGGVVILERTGKPKTSGGV